MARCAGECHAEDLHRLASCRIPPVLALEVTTRATSNTGGTARTRPRNGARQSIHMGLRVLKTPPRSPKANSLCERVIGTLRRECLDFLIPLTENHLRIVTKNWVEHYNRGRPHSSLGPGIPDPPVDLPVTPNEHRCRIPSRCKIAAHPILGGLHHEYGLLAEAA